MDRVKKAPASSENLVSQGFKYGKTFAEVDRDVDIYLNNLEFEKNQLTLFNN